MLHFTKEAEPKISIHHHPLLERLSSSFNEANLGLAFAPAPIEEDELLQSIDDEIASRQMTIDDLQERPDLESINRFLDGALEDFRRDGFTYSED